MGGGGGSLLERRYRLTDLSRVICQGGSGPFSVTFF